MNFPSHIFFNNINHGYRAAISKTNYLWLLPFFIAVATSRYYEKVRRTMRTAIVWYLFKWRSQSWANFSNVPQKYFSVDKNSIEIVELDQGSRWGDKTDNPAGIYRLKVHYRNTRTRYEICSKLTIKTTERRHWRRSGVFIVNFE